MKVKIEHLALAASGASFKCYEVSAPAFEFYWHYHPEFELAHIVSGRGVRLVGDSQEPFSEGDLVLLGPNLPHTWVGERGTSHCRAQVLQFQPAAVEPLLALPEFLEVKNLLKKSEVGLYFPATDLKGVASLLDPIGVSSGAAAFAHLLLLLDWLARQSAVPLASARPLLGMQQEQRIRAVLSYVQEQFAFDISLREAARHAHLSESAFCKFFKRATGKTFSDYVNNVRLSHACSLLLGTDKPVAHIAVECGFENMAYFNRVFLKRRGVSPRLWRRQR